MAVKKPNPYDRGPIPRTPNLRPGERLRLLNRKPGEDGRQAQARARTMPWWPTVTSTEVYWTASKWVWVARDESATMEEL